MRGWASAATHAPDPSAPPSFSCTQITVTIGPPFGPGSVGIGYLRAHAHMVRHDPGDVQLVAKSSARVPIAVDAGSCRGYGLNVGSKGRGPIEETGTMSGKVRRNFDVCVIYLVAGERVRHVRYFAPATIR